MSTKIGLITEGPIDEVLLSALLERIARERADFSWPTIPDDLGALIPVRKRGHGGVLDAVRRLVAILEEVPFPDHALFIILLDRKTRPVQEAVRRLIRGNHLFVLGIAIEEVEAWWLADRRNTFTWLGLDEGSARGLRYMATSYSPERDQDPKVTLDELTVASPNLTERYGNGNTELAREFALDYWLEYAELEAIEVGCPEGFRPFCRKIAEALRREKRRQEEKSRQERAEP